MAQTLIKDSLGRLLSEYDVEAVNAGWHNIPPTEPGMYLYRDFREWVHRFVVVTKGEWRRAQDPDKMYGMIKGVDTMIDRFEAGWWFGPLARSPENNWPIG